MSTSRTATALLFTTALVGVGLALAVPPSHADGGCGASQRSTEPTANPRDGNEVWVDDGGIAYSAPGGATPRRAASVGTDGSIGVTLAHELAGEVNVGVDDDGPCHTGGLDVPEDRSNCDKPVGGPVSPRPANAAADDPYWLEAGSWQEIDVTFTSNRTCATLTGTLYGPSSFDDTTDPLPAVLVLPPSGGAATGEQVEYLAKTLAADGYIALTAVPQGTGRSDLTAWPACGTEPGYSHPSPCHGQPFQRVDNWMETARTGLDYLLSVNDYDPNPWAAFIDHDRIGATGHSQGARAASYLQDPFHDYGDDSPTAEPRIHAVVGLDNLSADYYGDASADSGNGFLGELGLINPAVNGQPMQAVDGSSEPIRITVPGLGLGSDDERTDPHAKKTAMHAHRDGGQPTGMLIFDGVAHGDFSQSAGYVPENLFRFAHYTHAWFDRWLRDDAGAVERLLTRSIDGVDVATILSDTEYSGWHLPGALVDCEHWQSPGAYGPGDCTTTGAP